MSPVSPADYAHMPWPARRRYDTIRALEAKAALGHSASAKPRDVAYTAALLLAELPIDPAAAEHRLTLHHAIEGKTAA